MYTIEYYKALETERAGKLEEGFQMLQDLADAGDPNALLDLSGRYLYLEGYVYPVKQIEPNELLSEELAIRAKCRLEELANNGDGEAMRMLASTYLGHWHPVHEKSIEIAECWLLRSYEAKCYFAANDLAIFYRDIDIDKAKIYYLQAE